MGNHQGFSLDPLAAWRDNGPAMFVAARRLHAATVWLGRARGCFHHGASHESSFVRRAC
jgi:hypothetical protein